MSNIEPGLFYIAIENFQVIFDAKFSKVFRADQRLACILSCEEEATNTAFDIFLHKINSDFGDNLQRMLHCLGIGFKVLQHAVASQLMQRGKRAEDGLDIGCATGQLLV